MSSLSRIPYRYREKAGQLYIELLAHAVIAILVHIRGGTSVMPMAIAAGLCVLCCLVVLGHTLPVDPRADRRDGRPPDSKKFPSKYPNVGDILDDAGKLRRPPMPDTPGLDPEEYNRYWKEMAKDNPGVFT